MDGVCDNHIGVTAVSVTKSHKSLAAAHVTYAHEHIYAWNIMAQNNNIAVQVVAHVIDITCDGCSVACTPAIQPCNGLATTHCIIYHIASNHAIMTHMTSVPIIFFGPIHS
jgi:hypothetical protein